jgi:PadR family transcriptional regulator, regulatory protein AphA
MNYTLVEKDGKNYLECLPGRARLKDEQSALDLVAACGEYRTNRILLHANNLSKNFFRLRTGVAGAVLLKFVTYSIKVAAVLSPELVHQGKFHDMVIEANRGSQFHVFYEREKAESWLIND